MENSSSSASTSPDLGWQVHGAAKATSVARLEDVPPQPCRRDRLNRPFRGSREVLAAALRRTGRRRKHLGKLLSRSNKAMRNGIQLSGGDRGRHLSSCVLDGPRRNLLARRTWPSQPKRQNQECAYIQPPNCFFWRNGGKVRSYAGMAPKNSVALMSPGFTDIAQAARLDSLRRARRGTSVILASAST